MALDKKTFEIAFNEGVDTISDKKIMQGGFLAIENGVFRTQDTITKRPGYASHGNHYISLAGVNTPLATTGAKAINVFDSELILHGDSFKSFSPAKNLWIEKGYMSPCIVTCNTVLNGVNTKTYRDMTINGGIEVYSYYESGVGLKCTVIDSESGTIFQYGTLISATGTKSRVLSLGGSIFIFYIDTAAHNIVAAKIDITNPTSISKTFKVVGAASSDDNLLDAITVGDKALLVWSDTSNKITMSYCSQGGICTAVGGAGIPDPIQIALKAITVLSVLYNSITDTIWVVHGDNTNGLRCGVYTPQFLLELAATTVIDNYVTKPLKNVTGSFLTGTTLTCYYEYDMSAVVPKLNFIKTNTLQYLTPTVGTASVFMYNAGIASKSWVRGTNIYFIATYQSPTQTTVIAISDPQATCFLMDNNKAVRARILSNSGIGYSSRISSVTIDSNKTYCVLGIATQLNSISSNLDQAALDVLVATAGAKIGDVVTVTGGSKVELDFDSDNLYFSENLNGIMHIAGGQLDIYDGSNVVEHGFHTFPGESVPVITAALNVPKSKLTYRMIWRWTDRKGNIYRSYPSLPHMVDLTGAAAGNTVTWTIPSLTFTNKNDVVCEVYRTTTLDGLNYYKVGQVANNKAAATITFADGLADAAISVNELLYISGGTLPNLCPPSSKLITLWKNRITLATEDNKIIYSKPKLDFQGIEFNSDYIYKDIDADGGKTKAIKAMDANLIIFKKSRIYYINGNPSNELGTNEQLSDCNLITTDCGCSDSNSLVYTDVGIIFKTEKGIYSLGRDLKVEYIGAKVKRFNSLKVLSAQLHATVNEARILLENNIVLVYNYFFQKWTWFINILATDAIVHNGLYTYLGASSVCYETPLLFKDLGKDIKLTIETAWIKTAGVQGFQRVYWIHALGDYLGAHKLEIKINYNYDEAFEEVVEFDPSLSLGSTVWGGTLPIGTETWGKTGTTWGGSGDLVYQFRHMPQLQQCQSFKLTFKDIASDGSEAYSLSHLLCTVGIKNANFKIKSTKTI